MPIDATPLEQIIHEIYRYAESVYTHNQVSYAAHWVVAIAYCVEKPTLRLPANAQLAYVCFYPFSLCSRRPCF